MSLYRGEPVFDESNFQELTGDGSEVVIGHERYKLARLPPRHGFDQAAFSKPYAATFKAHPRHEWDARIDEQISLKSRVSDFIDFEQFYQNGLPTCWAICTAQAGTTTLRIAGQPFRQLSGCSLAVPISGGRSGGYEGDSVQMMCEEGCATVRTWPENNTSRSLINDAAVKEDRKNNQVLECFNIGDDFDLWATAALDTQCGPFAYDWMRHCMMTCDLVRIEAGSYGLRVRNTWRPWGAKNDLGFDGFATYREGRGTPDSGYILRSITPWSGVAA